MKYNLISMDFDGTLLSSDKKVSDVNKEILIKYRKSNYYIVGITARNFSSVNNVCNIKMFDYVILNNGAYIYDVKKDEAYEIDFIEEELVKSITRTYKKIANEIDYCAFNNYYMDKEDLIVNKKYNIKINNIKELKEKIVRINIFLKNINEIEKYNKEINAKFNSLTSFIMLDTDKNKGNKWISINPKGTSKFIALKKLCDKLNINLENVIFFGDSANDLEIIKKVGMGVAMGNALEEVKRNSKAITLSNDENGIYYFLNKLKYKIKMEVNNYEDI